MTETSDDIRGLPARRAARDLLTAALARRSGLDEAAGANAFRGLEPRDRARTLCRVAVAEAGLKHRKAAVARFREALALDIAAPYEILRAPRIARKSAPAAST
ncbi:MAG TPA: hypothetical protein PK913_00660, partial [Phenylobacterium sp.]|nr:hypothetical protein [Phenylobacterium sp.]